MGTLYKLIEKKVINDSYIYKLKFANKSHPVFQAHFPNYPLLPGFMQLEIAASLLHRQIYKIHFAKFNNQIFPDDSVEFHITNKESGFKVKTIKQGQKCAEFFIE